MTKLPQRLNINLTTRCNLRCIMCIMHCADRPGEGLSPKYHDMDEDVFHRLEPLAAQARVITLGGCGEPLLDRKAIDRIGLLRKWNRHAKIIAYTNGVRLRDPDWAEGVLPLLTDVHWSLNGVSQYESIQIGASFAATEAALRVVRDFRRDSGGHPRLSIDFIVMRRSVVDIVPAAQLAQEYEASELVFKDCTVHCPEIASESIRHDAVLKDAVQAEIEKARKYGVRIVWPDARLPASPAVSEQGIEIPCDAPWTQAQVTVEGDVLLCCFGDTHVGNLHDADFVTIWDGKEAKLYRQGLLTGKYHKDCAKCRMVLPDDPVGYERLCKR